MTHCRPAVVASRSRAMSGSATLITVESSISTNRPMQAPARVHQRRFASVRPGSAPIRAAGTAMTQSSRLPPARAQGLRERLPYQLGLAALRASFGEEVRTMACGERRDRPPDIRHRLAPPLIDLSAAVLPPARYLAQDAVE